MELYDENSAIDLMLRGYGRAEVRELTGEDIGYNGRSLREAAACVDRDAYRVGHVLERVGEQRARDALTRFAEGASGPEILSALGLRNPTLVKLKDIYAALGLGAEFKEADAAHRSGVMRAGMKAKHGVENPFELASVQTQAAATRQSRYGAAYTLQEGSSLSAGARESIAAGMADPVSRQETLSKRAMTNMERLGVEYPAQDAGVRAKMRATSLARHGVPHAAQTVQNRQAQSEWAQATAAGRGEKARSSNLARYGVVHPAQTQESRDAQSERMLDADHQRRLLQARKANGTTKASAPEDALYALLVERFGPDDVLRQHRDESRYPFACDFYVPSRDLFVELNGSWTHGGHWYEAGSEGDETKLGSWARKGTAFYDKAVEVFTQRDVAKRAAAREAGLNYVVFWDGSSKLLDARLWLALDAPDGHDWAREHSWLPERAVSAVMPFPELKQGVRHAQAVARAATEPARRERELGLWEADATHPRKWGRLRCRLLANRLHYLGKSPDALTDAEVLRGLGIAGEIRPWTVFDNTGMRGVLERYAPKAIYDPCAGWGERLATCAAAGVGYEGTDISPEVVAGHERLVEHYGLTEQHTTLGDSAQRDMRAGAHQMVFTCPPYGDTEVYTELGAENLAEAEFLSWWAQVVELSTGAGTRVFAYQVSQLWKDRMNEALVAAGWTLVEQIPVGAGRGDHFSRAGGGKKEFEEVQVFTR